MGRRSKSPAWKAFDASARKTFHSAICHLLQIEFPGVFGPAITHLFADKIDELYARFHPPGGQFRVGQVLWAAVAVDDPPGRDKRIEDTRLVPVILDLVTAQDIHEATVPGTRGRTARNKIVRLCNQAHAQGGVLSLADVGLLLHMSISQISKEILAHEHGGGDIVPRRGTVHDMGRSLTHKAIICFKRLVEKKPTSQVAQETYHTPDEVEYYVQCFRRIQACRDGGLSKEDTALATGHSLSLVQEYLDLMGEFNLPPVPTTPRKASVQSAHD
jgi:uncharacterized protein DUF1670